MLAEAVEIGEELDDTEICAEALWWLVPSFVALCDHDAARDALDRLFDLAQQLSEPFRLHVAEHYASALALCDGDLARAEAAALRSHEWSGLLTGRDASGVHGIQMFGVRREQGRLAELAPVVRVLAATASGGAWAPGLTAVLAELGMHDEARRELDTYSIRGARPLRESLWLATLTYLADASATVGDTEMAASVYPELEAYRGTNVQIGHLVACYGSADRYLGMLATVLGDWPRAEEHFATALALNGRLGARTWTRAHIVTSTRACCSRAVPVTIARMPRRCSERASGSPTRSACGPWLRTLQPTRRGRRRLPGAAGRSHAREVEILRLAAQGLLESPDRPGALHQRAHCRKPHPEHPAQDGLCESDRGRSVRTPSRSRG